MKASERHIRITTKAAKVSHCILSQQLHDGCTTHQQQQQQRGINSDTSHTRTSVRPCQPTRGVISLHILPVPPFHNTSAHVTATPKYSASGVAVAGFVTAPLRAAERRFILVVSVWGAVDSSISRTAALLIPTSSSHFTPSTSPPHLLTMAFMFNWSARQSLTATCLRSLTIACLHFLRLPVVCTC